MPQAKHSTQGRPSIPRGTGRPMNRGDEFEFAWALVEAARPFLTRRARTWICAKIGAGEQQSAIRELLAGFASSDTPLPVRLTPMLWAWIRGFVGSDGELGLVELATRIRVATNVCPHVEAERPPTQLVARRRDKAPRDIVLSSAPEPTSPSIRSRYEGGVGVAHSDVEQKRLAMRRTSAR